MGVQADEEFGHCRPCGSSDRWPTLAPVNKEPDPFGTFGHPIHSHRLRNNHSQIT